LSSGEAYETLSTRFGAFREFVLVARDSETGDRIGGANFIALPLNIRNQTDSTVLSLNLNYIFINRAVRQHGYLRRLVSDLPDLALQLLRVTNPADIPSTWTSSRRDRSVGLPIWIFIEQNDPCRMSPQDYELHTKYSGIDQIARIRIWPRRAAKIVDFPYVQPPLSADQQADSHLVYAVLGAARDSIDACPLHSNLSRFFGISVLKGRDPHSESSTREQLSTLDRLCSIPRPVHLLSVGDDALRQASNREHMRDNSISPRALLRSSPNDN
jgi:hypothetical protein